jgi:hypothetical protein
MYALLIPSVGEDCEDNSTSSLLWSLSWGESLQGSASLSSSSSESNRTVVTKQNGLELTTDGHSTRETFADIEAKLEVVRGPVKELQAAIEKLRSPNGDQDRRRHTKSSSFDITSEKPSGIQSIAGIDAKAQAARALAKQWEEQLVQPRRRSVGH